jgi:hypothetical protein
MRNVFVLAVLGAIIFAAAPGQAQSPYSYPWCALNPNRSGATSCYFETRAQCEASVSGGGGTCIRSPYYRSGARSR